MKFNIYFTLKGPAGMVETENSTNPVESETLESCLEVLSQNLPNNENLGITTVGIKIEFVSND